MHFSDLTWMQVEEYLKRDNRLMFVIGSTEQHGYLSLLADTKIPLALAEAAWEPFAGEKYYPWKVATNWIGVWIYVQFRDDQGNVSPIYSDDISIEGMYASPTSMPTP